MDKNNLLWAGTPFALTRWDFLSVPSKVLFNSDGELSWCSTTGAVPPCWLCALLCKSRYRRCKPVLFCTVLSCRCRSPIQVSPGWQLPCPRTIVPSCSLTLRSSPLGHLVAFLGEVLWKAEWEKARKPKKRNSRSAFLVCWRNAAP